MRLPPKGGMHGVEPVEHMLGTVDFIAAKPFLVMGCRVGQGGEGLWAVIWSHSEPLCGPSPRPLLEGHGWGMGVKPQRGC